MAGLNMNAGQGKDFAPAPVGNHRAVCTRVIDMGTRFEVYQGVAKDKPRHTLRVAFELPDCRMEDGRPFLVSEKYTASLAGKTNNFRAMLEGWRGRTFDAASQEAFHPKVLLGLPAMVNIVHENGYANIAGVTPIPRDAAGNPLFPKPSPEGDVLFLELTPDAFDSAVFDKLSDKMRAHIATSHEFKAMFPGGLWKVGEHHPAPSTAAPESPAGGPQAGGYDDDIPF